MIHGSLSVTTYNTPFRSPSEWVSGVDFFRNHKPKGLRKTLEDG